MPSIYAHYRFGQEIFELLPEELKTITAKYRDLFNIGLQGPDLLFFYQPVFHNYVNRLGYQIHDWKGRKFFQPAARIIRNSSKPERLLAYICGVVCHYALDVTCHPYVDSLVSGKHLNHCAIEGSFERTLIVEDHLPLNALVTGFLIPTKQNASIIAQFYGHTTAKQILSAIRCMKWLNDGLRMKDNLLKKGIFVFLRLIGKYDNISGMVITPKPLPEFAESDKELRKLYEIAKPKAIVMMKELLTSIESGQKLNSMFYPTFSG